MRVAFLFILLISSAHAKDFGIVGEVIPIKENDIIDVIRERAESISKSEKDLIQKKVRSHYQKKLRNPVPVDLLEAKMYSVHYFDPTISVNEDIKDHEGKVIVKKGSKHNPLSTCPLINDLLLFNGDDLEQVEWAKSKPGTWILVKGRPLDLEESERRAVFFDQGGVICKKFGIKAVPARVSQEELRLKVESIPKGVRS